MTAFVRRHYPVVNLPADLRRDLPDTEWVEIEIRPEATTRLPEQKLARLVGTGSNVHGGEADVLNHIRSLRDDR